MSHNHKCTQLKSKKCVYSNCIESLAHASRFKQKHYFDYDDSILIMKVFGTRQKIFLSNFQIFPTFHP